MDFQTNLSPSIIFFDDDCLVCNQFVHFLIKQDKGRGLFRFTTLQSTEGVKLAQKAKMIIGKNKESMILKENDKVFFQSTAFLKILCRLGGGWLLVYPFLFFPPFFRNYLYDFFSKNRHRLRNKNSSCKLLLAHERKYFINN